MLINLNELFSLKNISKLNNLKVKILEVREKSTIILIKGHRVEIPYVLDKNKNYTISFDKNIDNFKIVETKFINNNILKEGITSFLENFFDLSKLDQLDFKSYYNYLFNNNENNKKIDDRLENKSNFIFKNNNKDFFFIFNTFFFKIKSSIFLKVSENKTVSFLLYLKGKLENKNEIIKDIEEKLSNIKFEKIIIFDNDKTGYINEISSIFKNRNIDIVI